MGVPFNIASYAALTHMFAQQAGLKVGELIWTGGDCHIYNDHVEQVKEQLSREPRPYPQLNLHKAEDMFSYDFADFEIEGYDPTPPSKRRCPFNVRRNLGTVLGRHHWRWRADALARSGGSQAL